MSAEWLSSRIGDPTVKIIESDEDHLHYDIGHIPGAMRLDCQTDLSDPVTRDVVGAQAFADLMRVKGIGRDDTVVLYGDKNNRWAAYALWVFTLFGHPDVRLLDGGRDKWTFDDRETTLELPWPTESQYPTVERDDITYRIFRDELLREGKAVIDARAPRDYSGDPTPALRGGHIPGARNLPWDLAIDDDGRFHAPAELAQRYIDLSPTEETVVYCHTGELAAHTWFTLAFLLGFRRVRCYDGSWAEWGNAVRAPIAVD